MASLSGEPERVQRCRESERVSEFKLSACSNTPPEPGVEGIPHAAHIWGTEPIRSAVLQLLIKKKISEALQKGFL